MVGLGALCYLPTVMSVMITVSTSTWSHALLHVLGAGIHASVMQRQGLLLIRIKNLPEI